MDQFILFGDSLTQQAFSPEGTLFGPALANAYIRKLDIVNRGFSGYNTSQALEILPKFFSTPSQARVRLLTIFFGANDARLSDTPGGPQQHVPLDKFKENLRKMATHPCVLAHEGIRIILITPPPVDERMLQEADLEKFGERMLRRTASTTWTYTQAVRELGKELRIPVLDLWAGMLNEAGMPITRPATGPVQGSKEYPANLERSLRDGLHFTRNGYKVLYEELMWVVGKAWPEQLPENLGFALPAWDDEEAWKGMEVESSLEREQDGAQDGDGKGIKRQKINGSL